MTTGRRGCILWLVGLFNTSIKGAALALLAGASTAALATGWRVEPGLIPPATIERLAERFPDVKDANTLETLLREIGRRHATLRLDARFEAGVWVIGGTTAELIAEIDVEMTSRALAAPLAATVQNYIGQVDSPEVRGKIKALIQRYLKKRGYPAARVRVRDEAREGGRHYTFEISEGDPCLIDRIELGFRLPFGIEFGMRGGDVCDVEEINIAMSRLDEALRERGYNQLKLELQDLAYTSDMRGATVFISGILGQRVRYEIVDLTKRFLIDDLFADDELTKVDPSIVGPDAMAAELARRYRNRGFLDVAVKGPDVQKVGDDEFVYRYNVEPGTQYLLESVEFEGATVFTNEEMLETMGLKSLWKTARPPINLEDIQDGVGGLKARYQQRGYWDAEVRDPGVGQKDRDTGTVRLTIQIQEGAQRLLGAIQIKGNQALSTETLAELLDAVPGDPLDRAKLVKYQQDMRTAYLSLGYLYADVQIDLKASEIKRGIRVDVLIDIKEGPRVKVGDVTIIGLVKTDPKVVRRELLFETGDWYDPQQINLSRQALTRLGLFRSVQITWSDRSALSEKSPELDLIVDVREGRAGNVAFGPGWSLAKGLNYGAEASYNNIGGVGRQASVRGSVSQETNQKAIGAKTLVGRKIGAGYREPYLLDQPVDGLIAATQTAEWGGELWELKNEGELALLHTLRVLIPGSTLTLFYGQKIAKTEGTLKAQDELLASDVRIGQTGLRYALDERDSLKFPTAGYTFDAATAWARYGLGGDIRYFRWDVGSSHYFGVTPDWVVALGFNLTSYEEVQRRNEDLIGVLPTSERLSAGGTDTVRGYAPESLGPVVRSPTIAPAEEGCGISFNEDPKPLEANRRTVIKTELRYKVNDQFATAAFVDNGNVFFSKDQMDKFQRAYGNLEPEAPEGCDGATADYTVEENVAYEYAELLRNPGYIWSRHYYSYGLSFNLLTALGSVNLAYGLPWREPKTERCANEDICYPRAKRNDRHWLTRGEFHINVGARF